MCLGLILAFPATAVQKLFEVPQFQSLEVFLSSPSWFTAGSGWLEHEGLQATSPFWYCVV